MKFTALLPRRTSRQGNVLIMTVVVTGLVGFTLASYLTLVKSQNMSTFRSQAWNSTVPVIEAGIEDAMAHLNKNGTNRLDLDGWTKEGDIYWMRRFFNDSFYVVTISNWFNAESYSPVVISRGYVRMPVQVVSRSDIMLAATGTESSTAVPSGYLARGVLVHTRKASLFAKGMVAKGQIDLNGNNVDTDSFDSTDPAYSTDGQYDPAKKKYNGSVATNSGLTNSLSVGNANIRGKVSTGPGGSVDIGPTGKVGGADWYANGSKGIEPGYASDDMNVDFSDVDTPYTSGAYWPGPGTVDGTAYTYVLNDGKYWLSSLSLSGDMAIRVTGNASLYVTGNISMIGNSAIQIDDGASLELYGGGYSTAIGGNGVINKDGSALSFAYYGLPSNRALSFSGNGEFVGTIYAPNADFTLNAGGKSGGIDFTGASVTKTVTLNGQFNFHYDEALEDHGPDRGYVVTAWNEMAPDAVTQLTVSLTSSPIFNTTETTYTETTDQVFTQ